MPGSVYEDPLWHTFLLLPFFSLIIVVYSRRLILTVSDDVFDELKFKLNNKTEKRLKKARTTEKQVYECRNERDDKWTEECTISRYIPIKFTVQSTKDDYCKEHDDFNVLFSTTVSPNEKRIKILTKGDRGTGKTRMIKKILYKWSKATFRKQDLIISLSLKLANPYNSSEDEIVHQNTGFKKHLSQLRKILNSTKFGKRCWILLDGLNEHNVENNKDIKAIIEDKILMHCNILVTVTSSSAGPFEHHFQTTATLNGVEKFVAKKRLTSILRHVKEKDKCDELLNLESELMSKSIKIIDCPMLFRIVCFLLYNKEMKISEKITLGQLYYKLVLSLYMSCPPGWKKLLRCH